MTPHTRTRIALVAALLGVATLSAAGPTAAQELTTGPDSIVRVQYVDESDEVHVRQGALRGATPTALRIEVGGVWGRRHTVEIPRSSIRRTQLCSGCSPLRQYLLTGAGAALGWVAAGALVRGEESDCIMCFTGRDAGVLMAGLGGALVGGLIGSAVDGAFTDWHEMESGDEMSIRLAPAPGAGVAATLRIPLP